MAVLVNDPAMQTDLYKVLSTNICKVSSFSLVNESSPQFAWSTGSSSPVMMNMGPGIAYLHVTFSVDEIEIIASPDNKDLLQNLEEKIGDFCSAIDGLFLERRIVPFRERRIYEIEYKLRIKDFAQFGDKVHNMALSLVDKEFIAALEEKLSED